jgi:hypothetical protein
MNPKLASPASNRESRETGAPTTQAPNTHDVGRKAGRSTEENAETARREPSSEESPDEHGTAT